MFRGVSNLKGLIIDIDSFDAFDKDKWLLTTQKYKCLFMTADDETQQSIENAFSPECVYALDWFSLIFAPNRNTHFTALKKLKLETSEVAYVSRRHTFLENAMSFVSGTIWIHQGVTDYKELTNCPDVFCPTIESLADTEFQRFGIFGDAALTPSTPLMREKRTIILKTRLLTSNEELIPLFIMGRYYGASHYMSSIHPFSAAILANKRKGGKNYGAFDGYFRKIFEVCIRVLIKDYGINSISRVPPRPGEQDRFGRITQEIAENLDIEDVSGQLVCVKNYTSQKNLSAADRAENVKGKFQTSGNLLGKTVVLIDDVVSTGSTLTECANQLKAAGAQVVALVLAINQFGSYWTVNLPGVECSVCGDKMRLQVSSKDLKFFYSCFSCFKNGFHSPTFSFTQGNEQWISSVNREIDSYQEIAEDDGI